MIRLEETYQERLNKWIDPNHYKHLPGAGCITIDEGGTGQSWKLDCHIKNEAVLFRLEKKRGFQYLRQKKIADAVILEALDQETVRLHIIECKKTVGAGAWRHIKRQFEGALLNALGLLGILGIGSIRDVVFYTAYLRDRISLDQNPRPSTLKEKSEENDSQWPVDWLANRISILSIRTASHIKIQLSETDQSLEGVVELE